MEVEGTATGEKSTGAWATGTEQGWAGAAESPSLIDPFTPGQGSLNHTLPTLNPDQAILPGLLGPTSWLGPAQVFQGPAPSPLGPAPALQAPPNGEAGFCSR